MRQLPSKKQFANARYVTVRLLPYHETAWVLQVLEEGPSELQQAWDTSSKKCVGASSGPLPPTRTEPEATLCLLAA